MRILLLAALIGLTFPLTACNSDPNSPALRAMQPVNACGPGGTSDINQCSSRR